MLGYAIHQVDCPSEQYFYSEGPVCCLPLLTYLSVGVFNEYLTSQRLGTPILRPLRRIERGHPRGTICEYSTGCTTSLIAYVRNAKLHLILSSDYQNGSEIK